ncbi:hypothetical protein IC620_14755 [Hazenella sp. IB182357]|uniref:Uncharacterized protein n=1 Tax=Polycladospora coralii TaxID=2771432 RepID=A0A926RU66_9BACL|nr:hypothetical protein [Polycladospora coralii]MBD1373605.1 hypothetical protein [Polycladospora coralii]
MIKKSLFTSFSALVFALILGSNVSAQTTAYTFDCFFKVSTTVLAPDKTLNGDNVKSMKIEFDQDPDYYFGLSVCLTDENKVNYECRRLVNGEKTVSFDLEEGKKYKAVLYNFVFGEEELHLTGKVYPTYR